MIHPISEEPLPHSRRKKPGPPKGTGFCDPRLFARIQGLLEEGARSPHGAIKALLRQPEWAKHGSPGDESRVRTIQRGYYRWIERGRPPPTVAN